MRSVLAVGGSDSGGGAGLQADLRTLAACGVHGTSVVTAVTAQDSTAVHGTWELPTEAVVAQLRAVLTDLRPDVVKTGMLANERAVMAVAELTVDLPLVVDPVGTSSTGQRLLSSRGLDALREHLLPLATVVTPNLAEVQALTGVVVRDADDLLTGARAVRELGPRWVLVTGGHLPGSPDDLLWDGHDAHWLRGTRVAGRHDHGTGCTLASALAARMALGDDVPTAARAAKAFVAGALARGYAMGVGPGPVRQV